MANDEFCKKCEQEFQQGQRKAGDRKAPLYGWPQPDCPLEKPLCWEHWAPDGERVNSYQQYVVKNKYRLQQAHLEYVIFDPSYPPGTEKELKLDGANLEEANLHWVNLKGANLRQANLSKVELHFTNLNDIDWQRYTPWVMLRDGFRRRDNRLPITRWDSICGIDTAKIDSVTRREIKDIAYIEDFRSRHKFLAWLWRWSCFYGQRIWLWALWCFVVAMVFGGIYSSGGLVALSTSDMQSLVCGNPITTELPSWLTPYYFSVVTFTTLGFGDIRPLNWLGELVVVFEVIAGYIALGLLISILANKVARRA